jgi:uncharacterized protein (TIGR03083 family)
MNEPEPVLTVDLFPKERQQLLALLETLSEEEWSKPTVCKGWSVKDIALHVLGDDIGVLSRKRDGHSSATQQLNSWEELVAFLNDWNERWVESARRISVPLLLDMLRMTGDELHSYFASLDLFAIGGPVSWAGPELAPVWLDVAREYTERWLHQQQIRDAVRGPGAKDRELFAPVLATFVRALPETYRDVPADDGTHVRLTIEGESGGVWSVVRQGESWNLYVDVASEPDASVRLDQEPAWRLFTKGIDKIESDAKIAGDRELGDHALDTVSIIA